MSITTTIRTTAYDGRRGHITECLDSDGSLRYISRTVAGQYLTLGSRAEAFLALWRRS